MGYADGYPVRLVGGRLALDFVNTADWSADGRITHEKLTSLDDVEVWKKAAGLALATPTDLADLLSFREALRQRLLHPEQPAAKLPDLNMTDGEAPELCDALLISAQAILLDRRERQRLKVCIGDGCGWMFIDESRGARRQWCSMESCGNRAKARRHYARRKAASRPSG